MLDLNRYQFSREELKDNIYMLSLIEIVKTQKIDVTFAVRYILNKKYQLLEEEEKITLEFVLTYQTHITKEELLTEMANYDSDDDSIDYLDELSKNEK
jgi:hypothetical protein